MEPCKPSKSERNRQIVYQSIRDMLNAHYSYRQIVATLKVSKKTIAKVSSGNIENLCQTSCQSIWDPYSNEMLDGIRAGKTGKEIYIDLENRYKTIGKLTSFYNYIAQLAKDADLKLERYHHRPMPLPDGTIPKKDFDCIKRNGVLQYLWNGLEISQLHLDYLYREYPIIPLLRKRILEFREIFRWKNPYLLFLFIDNCKEGDNVKLSRFADGLNQDLEAVLNAVVSDLNNGFVEGINNKIKMVKRVMYGRCKLPLLKAKLIGRRWNDTVRLTDFCG